jgi:hypothetical protein
VPIGANEFYSTGNNEPARGDVYGDIPFLLSEESVAAFSSSILAAPSTPEEGTVAEIFADVSGQEISEAGIVAVQCIHLSAVCITPTCDIGTTETLLFLPLRPIAELKADHSELDERLLFSTTKGFDNLMGFYDPTDGEVGDQYVDFGEIFSVPASQIPNLKDRQLKSLSTMAQDVLTTKLARYFGKTWGYASDEPVEESGVYGCVVCRRYFGLGALAEVALTAGQLPPQCEMCRRQGLKASWRLLQKPKRSAIKSAG